jgi:hypothetical protein
MGNYGERALVEPGVSYLIPRIDARETKVSAIGGDEKSSNRRSVHACVNRISMSRTTSPRATATRAAPPP